MCGNNPKVAVPKKSIMGGCHSITTRDWQRRTHCACCVFGSWALLLPLGACALGKCWGLAAKRGLEVHVLCHVTRLTLANRNPFLDPPWKPTNWCLLEKF